MDTKTLYQEMILDHNKKPRNFGEVAGANRHADGHNPLCGDRIHLTLRLDGERIDAVAFTGESCAICKASASMMTAAIKGRSAAEAETLIQEFRDMTTGKMDVAAPGHHLGRLTVFAGVRDLPTRVKCAVLPWHTLHAALENETATSTEADADPMKA